jgi:hypothetical protein
MKCNWLTHSTSISQSDFKADFHLYTKQINVRFFGHFDRELCYLPIDSNNLMYLTLYGRENGLEIWLAGRHHALANQIWRPIFFSVRKTIRTDQKEFNHTVFILSTVFDDLFNILLYLVPRFRRDKTYCNDEMDFQEFSIVSLNLV